MSTSRPFPAVLAALVLLAAGCVGRSHAASAPAAAGAPYAVTITTEVAAGGRTGTVSLRATVVGDRRHVVLDTPLGQMGEHVVTPHDHWIRLSPTAAEPLGFPTDWIHIPLDELGDGVELPASLAQVEAPLPDPASVGVGDLVYGSREVVRVVDRRDGEATLVLDDGRTVVVRRVELPAGTTVDAPASAVDIRALPDLVGT